MAARPVRFCFLPFPPTAATDHSCATGTSFFKKTSILENTAESLPAYFLTLTKILIFVKNYRSDEDCVSGCRDDGNIVVGSD